MIHVFAVTSHLTFHIARKIAERQALSAEDCVLLLLRDYHIPPEYAAVFPYYITTSYNVDIDKGRIFSGMKFWQTRRNIRTFDRLVDAVIKDRPFLWYTPVCSNDICSLMVTKRNCQGYYITEDGFASYRDYNPQTFTGVQYGIYRLVLRPLFPRIFTVKNHFIETQHPKYRGCIATSQRCFPLHQDKLTVIGFPFEPMVADLHPDAVISVDPLYQFIDLDRAEAVYKQLAAYMGSHHHYQSVMYKMHPRFDANSNALHRKEYQALLQKYFPDAQPLASSVVLESLLASTHADFYSCNSSVAIYASQVGTQCYNFMPLLENTAAYDYNRYMSEITIPVTAQDIG